MSYQKEIYTSDHEPVEFDEIPFTFDYTFRDADAYIEVLDVVTKLTAAVNTGKNITFTIQPGDDTVVIGDFRIVDGEAIFNKATFSFHDGKLGDLDVDN